MTNTRLTREAETSDENALTVSVGTTLRFVAASNIDWRRGSKCRKADRAKWSTDRLAHLLFEITWERNLLFPFSSILVP